MIYDLLKNVSSVGVVRDSLAKALQWADVFDVNQPDGRYEIDGEAMYAIVVTYDSKPVSKLFFESHEKYIDVQIVLDGQEYLDVALDEALTVRAAYDPEDDASLWDYDGAFSSLVMKPGRFAILWPSDVHRPARKLDKVAPVRKLVVKVRV